MIKSPAWETLYPSDISHSRLLQQELNISFWRLQSTFTLMEATWLFSKEIGFQSKREIDSVILYNDSIFAKRQEYFSLNPNSLC